MGLEGIVKIIKELNRMDVHVHDMDEYINNMDNSTAITR